MKNRLIADLPGSVVAKSYLIMQRASIVGITTLLMYCVDRRFPQVPKATVRVEVMVALDLQSRRSSSMMVSVEVKRIGGMHEQVTFVCNANRYTLAGFGSCSEPDFRPSVE